VPLTRVMFHNATEDRFIRKSGWPRGEVISDQLIRFTGESPDEEGEIIAMMPHTLHFRPAILIHESIDVTLNDVTIHAQPGMGIVGHRGNNITMNRLSIIPSAGVHMSTNTDATHFTSCTGALTFDGCHIEGQGDDSTNIHNYYFTIAKNLGENNVQLRVDAPTGTHAQVLDHPDAGDVLELVGLDNLQPVQTYNVLDVKNFPQQWISEVTLDGKLPDDIAKYMLVDITLLPHVVMRNNTICNNNGRVLIKVRNVLIENNVIEKNVGTGIVVAAEGWWKEGLTSTDINICQNQILRCGGGISIHVDAKDKTAIGLQKRITIENNTIEGIGNEVGISINNAEDVTVRDNQIRNCHPGLKIQYSRHIQIVGNPEHDIEVGPGVSRLEIS
jgi:hypothetical protein